VVQFDHTDYLRILPSGHLPFIYLPRRRPSSTFQGSSLEGSKTGHVTNLVDESKFGKSNSVIRGKYTAKLHKATCDSDLRQSYADIDFQMFFIFRSV
jgi:hypothetical protein